MLGHIIAMRKIWERIADDRISYGKLLRNPPAAFIFFWERAGDACLRASNLLMVKMPTFLLFHETAGIGAV